MNIETRAIADLRPDSRNARKHGKRNLATIRASLEQFGQQRAAVIRSDGTVLAGNGMLEAALSLGWSDLAVTVVPNEWSDEQARAYALADNRTGELAEWDVAVLDEHLVELEVAGWDLDLLGFDAPQAVPSEPIEDELPPVPVDPVTISGELWQVGNQRILCGDASNAQDVSRLLGGRRINVAFTSPPYAEQRKYDASSGFKPIAPSDYVKWFQPIAQNVADNLQPDGSWFVNIKPASKNIDTELYVFDLVLAHVREWGWHYATEFCWERSGIPQQVVRRFKNQFEPIYQFVQNDWKIRPESVRHESKNVPQAFGAGAGDTNAAKRQGFKSAVDGNRVESGMAYPGNRLPTFSSSHDALGHSAAFPVGLPEFFVKAYSDEGDVIYDPFCGSGSTLVAAHRQNRTGMGIEISPAYVDVIVARLEKETGEKAVRVNG
jgi:DNA modification methylase